MTSRYVTEQVNRALVEARGNPSEAMRRLTSACAEDDRLLRAIVAPYLPGILRHTLSKMGGPDAAVDAATPTMPGARPGVPRPAALSDLGFDAVVGQLSRSIGVGTVPSRAAQILTPERRPPASQRHRDALHALAVAFARKRLEG
ncbi:MAG: hypothetical protein H6843_15495 [Rhodospirillaceae bacterium]|nr:hypothetical protein [Rhodospirillaceae bacterium]